MSVSARYSAAAAIIASALAFAAPAYAGPSGHGPSHHAPSHHAPSHAAPCSTCGGGGHIVRTPDVRIAGPSIHVGGPSVHTTIRGSHTTVVQSSRRTVVGGGDVFIFGRGGGSHCCAAPAQGPVTANLTVFGREALEREVVEIAPVRAVCIDAQGRPHPASRLSPDEEVAAGFDGEVFRCMAGTTMQATIGEASADGPDFDAGETIACEASEALRYRDGRLFCAAQEPRRDCFERSLLRRHGPGIKYVPLARTETVQRETPIAAAGGLTLSGGVGGACGC